MLYVSVIADMALLMGLIYSFHYKYAQPAVFYLKAPTLSLRVPVHRLAGAALRGALRDLRRPHARRRAGSP